MTSRTQVVDSWIDFCAHELELPCTLWVYPIIGYMPFSGPAYGKAKAQEYPSNGTALLAAALSACRDAMAFFSLNFTRVPLVKNWIIAGKPSLEISPQQNTESNQT